MMKSKTASAATARQQEASIAQIGSLKRLEVLRSPEDVENYRRYFKLGEDQYGEGDVFIDVRMGQVFTLAEEFIDMLPSEIEQLLVGPVHEVSAGAVSAASCFRRPLPPQHAC